MSFQLRYRFDILYFVYNATEFCNDWNVTSTYACIILNENPSDREQRDVVKDCGGPRLPPNYEQQVDYTGKHKYLSDNERNFLTNFYFYCTCRPDICRWTGESSQLRES